MAFLAGCPSHPKSATGTLTVVTTLFPLYDFARSVGRDRVRVSLLLPPGVEAHSFEPTPADIVLISRADVFVFTGRFMEPWIDDILKGVANKNLKVVDASTGIALASGGPGEPAGAPDPHIWLDFDNAKKMVDKIVRGLSEKDPVHARYYAHNGDGYADTLDRLDGEYRAALASCKNREVVYGGHYAFGYLARRYGLTYTAAQGISPDAEPTGRDLARLVDEVKRRKIRFIFFEELASPKIARTIADETGARLLLLNGAHNISREDFEKKVTFVSIMRKNLKNLETGLDGEE